MLQVKLSGRLKSSTQIQKKKIMHNVTYGNYLPSTDQKSMIIKNQLNAKNSSTQVANIYFKKKQSFTPRITSVHKPRPYSNNNAEQINDKKTNVNCSKIINNSNASVNLKMIKSQHMHENKSIKAINNKFFQQRKSEVFINKNNNSYSLKIEKKLSIPNQKSMINSKTSYNSSFNNSKTIQIATLNHEKKPLSRHSSFKGIVQKNTISVFQKPKQQNDNQFVQRIIFSKLNKNSKQKLERSSNNSKQEKISSLQKIKKSSLQKISARRNFKKKITTDSSLEVLNNQKQKKEHQQLKEYRQLNQIDLAASKKIDTPVIKQNQKKQLISKKNSFEGAQLKKVNSKFLKRQRKFEQIQLAYQNKTTKPKKTQFCLKSQAFCYQLKNHLLKQNDLNEKSIKNNKQLPQNVYLIDFLK